MSYFQVLALFRSIFVLAVISVNPRVDKSTKVALSRNKKIFYWVLMFVALLIMAGGVVATFPQLIHSGAKVPDYINLTWAHDQKLISQFIFLATMLWLMVSALFWGGWLLSRSIRKLKGRTWRIVDKNSNKLKFFPHVTLYLQLSCFYLLVIFLFVVSQYPLQYIIFT